MTNSNDVKTLSATGIIIVLALADGLLHLALNFILFNGRLWGSIPRPTPPPGAAPGAARPVPSPPPVPMPLPLTDLFTLNFIRYVVLALLFWFGPRWFGLKRWWIDIVLIIYAAVSILAWVDVGMPNPSGLGYLSKGMEILLIIVAGAHLWKELGKRGIAVGAA